MLGTGLALIDGEEVEVDLEVLLYCDLDVDGEIKLHEQDFQLAKLLLDACGRFTHFNLGRTAHKRKNTYALVKIVRSGVDGKPPLVDYTSAIKVRCTDVYHEIDYDDVHERDFVFSLPNIKSTMDLRNAMCARYCRVRGLEREEVLGMQVTQTELTLA